ncbi:MAG: ABC transporter ATP-binding protein [Anaerolineae bacterium]
MGFYYHARGGAGRPAADSGRRQEGETALPKGPVRLGRLLGYLRPYRGRLVLALIALLATTLIGLIFPFVIQTLIDSVLQSGDMTALNRITGALVALFVVRFFFGYIERFMLEYAGERVVIDIRQQVYRHLLDLPVQFFTERRSGEIVSRLASDASLVRTALTNNIATLISQLLTLIGAIAIVVMINWRMTLFVLALAPVMALIAAFFGRRVRAISTEVQDELAGSSTIVEEVLQGIRVVKSFVREQFEIERYNRSMERTFNAALRLTRVRAAFGPLIFSVMFMAIVAVLWFGGREVIAGRLTAGGLTSFLFYLMFIAGSFGAFTGLYTQLQEALGAARRIFEVLDTQPGIQDKPGAEELGAVEGRITFENVTFAYDERVDVLEDVSIEIEPGEVLALVGPSGAGKSTFVSMIPRFYDPVAGRILIDGHDLRDVTQRSLREQIGIVPQDTMLFGGTIRENILYGRLDASEEEIIAAAKAANAHEFIMALPDGYDTIVGERGVKLSGGQRQRVAIARAILKDPRILLLDEATSSLDSESEGLVQEALERLMQGRTTIIIAHRLSTVQIADRIAVLDRGHLVELGTHSMLLEQDGLYAKLYRMQFEAGLKEIIEAGLD